MKLLIIGIFSFWLYTYNSFIELSFTIDGKSTEIESMECFILTKSDTLATTRSFEKFYFNTDEEVINLLIKYKDVSIHLDSIPFKEKNKVSFGIINKPKKVRRDPRFKDYSLFYLDDGAFFASNEAKKMKKNESLVFATWNGIIEIKKDGTGIGKYRKSEKILPLK